MKIFETTSQRFVKSFLGIFSFGFITFFGFATAAFAILLNPLIWFFAAILWVGSSLVINHELPVKTVLQCAKAEPTQCQSKYYLWPFK